MKLKRKLLPIIGASAGIGATALALTGCSFFIGGDDSSWVNVLERYVPSGITQHDYVEGGMTADEALNDYYVQLRADHTTFAQDYYWWAYNAIDELQHSRRNENSASGRTSGRTIFSDMDAIKHSIKIVGDFSKAKKVSGTFDVEGEIVTRSVMLLSFESYYSYTYQSVMAKQGTTVEDVVTGRTELVNIPFIVENDGKLWNILPYQYALLDDSFSKQYPWAIDISATTVETVTMKDSEYGDVTLVTTKVTEKEYESRFSYSDEELEAAANELQQTAVCTSWFMYWVPGRK